MQDYPKLYDSFQQISALYLSAIPEEWKKRLLDDVPEGPTGKKP